MLSSNKKQNIKDGFTFIVVAIVLFVIISDDVYPFIIGFLKRVIEIVIAGFLILGFFTIIKALFKKSKNDNEDMSPPNINNLV